MVSPKAKGAAPIPTPEAGDSKQPYWPANVFLLAGKKKREAH